MGPFRYIYLYNDTPTSPADPLIGYFDYGANLTLNNGESLTIDFDQASGALTLADEHPAEVKNEPHSWGWFLFCICK